jgi:hypothetical protein
VPSAPACAAVSFLPVWSETVFRSAADAVIDRHLATPGVKEP